jgi:3-oxoacyl-[acyl-carrier-protein] synthase-1
MTTLLCVVTNGARTPLGLRAASSAAALRAGISAMAKHPFLLDRSGKPLLAALDRQLDPGLMGPARLLALAESALREACAPLHAPGAPGIPLPVYLGLPEFRPGFAESDAEAVRVGLLRMTGLPFQLREVKVFPQGHAAGLSALATAAEQIRQGAFETCLIGGVDSWFHPDTLGWLDANRQLAGAVSRSAFVPGEGAGFCLLQTEPACRRLGWKVLARVVAVAVGKEAKLIKTSDLCFGEGLATTVRDAVSGFRREGERINAVICDVNGERYRGEEWGFVCLRLSQHFDDPTAYLSPADCWGDTGAASSPLFAMLACQAAARGYAKGPHTLVWASSEGGLRGAAVLETQSDA